MTSNLKQSTFYLGLYFACTATLGDLSILERWGLAFHGFQYKLVGVYFLVLNLVLFLIPGGSILWRIVSSVLWPVTLPAGMLGNPKAKAK